MRTHRQTHPSVYPHQCTLSATSVRVSSHEQCLSVCPQQCMLMSVAVSSSVHTFFHVCLCVSAYCVLSLRVAALARSLARASARVSARASTKAIGPTAYCLLCLHMCPHCCILSATSD